MASTEQVLQLLGQVELFEGLSKGDLKKIHGLSKELTFEAGQNVITQKGKGGRFYLVVEGEAVICINDEDEMPIGVGAYFGEMSLIDGAERSATVTSGPEGATAFRLSPAALTDLIAKHPHTAVLLLKGLVTRVRELESRAGDATRG